MCVEGSVSNRKWSSLSEPALNSLPVTQQHSTKTTLGTFLCTIEHVVLQSLMLRPLFHVVQPLMIDGKS